MVRVGQKLKSQRLKKGLTLEEVAKATKIKTRFISAIENEEFEKLPSSAYAHGFVKNYARFLRLPEKETLALFRREYSLDKEIKAFPESLTEEEFPISRFRLSKIPKIAIFIFIILFGYLLFQYRYTVIDPYVSIFSPKEGEVLFSQTIEVVGKTDPNASVFINNEPVSVNGNGNFKKSINLFIGKTTITVKVVNYFGRETIIERQIEVLENT